MYMVNICNTTSSKRSAGKVVIQSSTNSREGVRAPSLLVLLAQPLVVRVGEFNRHEFRISAALGGTLDRPPFPVVPHLAKELLGRKMLKVPREVIMNFHH